MRSIFELSPREHPLKVKKTLRDFAFNKDGKELKAQYLKNIQEEREDKEYVDILNNEDTKLVEEELNLAGLNRGRQDLPEDPYEDDGEDEIEVSEDESSLMTEEEEAATSRIIDEQDLIIN